MQMFFFLGWGFLLLAFAGAAAEALPRTFPGSGTFVSAHELWYAASPGSLVVTQIQVERISPALWELLRASVLVLPAWVLFGVPGGGAGLVLPPPQADDETPERGTRTP